MKIKGSLRWLMFTIVTNYFFKIYGRHFSSSYTISLTHCRIKRFNLKNIYLHTSVTVFIFKKPDWVMQMVNK